MSTPPDSLTAARASAASPLIGEDAPSPTFVATLAAAVVAMSRISEEIFSQPLLTAAAGSEPLLQPVAAIAVITPCALGPLLAVFSFSSGPTPIMEFLASRVPWSLVALSCCSTFGALSFC